MFSGWFGLAPRSMNNHLMAWVIVIVLYSPQERRRFLKSDRTPANDIDSPANLNENAFFSHLQDD